MRGLHSSTKNPMLPGMKWIAAVLKERISHLPHLVISSEDLANKINKTRVSSNARLLKFDLKDYYLSGTPTELSEGATQHIPTHS